MKKVLVLGGNGFIASQLPYTKVQERISLNRAEIATLLATHDNPDVIVNGIGYCGSPTIDACETNKKKTYETNVLIPILIAEWCANNNAQMIHLSSGCIFCGSSPHRGCLECGENNATHAFWCRGGKIIESGWRETDHANPASYYSKTKYACDLAISDMPNVTTLRLRMPISSQYGARNFISKVRGYSDIIDIPNSVTFVDDLTRCIQWAIDNEKTGIYNVVNPKPLTAVQVMNEYQKYFPTHQFNIISEEQLGKITKAKRSNCILDDSKLRKAGFKMTDTNIALQATMKQYVQNLMEHNEKL